MNMFDILLDSGALWILIITALIFIGYGIYYFVNLSSDYRDEPSKPINLPPEFSIVSLNFNEYSRVAEIVFCETNRHRTIERYVQRNYVKYPVYSSDYKSRTKTIKKSIKLLNETLENLDKHPDPLIRQFAEEIITRINITAIMPSWYKRSILNKGIEKKRNNINSNLKIQSDSFECDIRILNQKKHIIEGKIIESSLKCKKEGKRSRKIYRKYFKRKSERIKKRLHIIENRYYTALDGLKLNVKKYSENYNQILQTINNNMTVTADLNDELQRAETTYKRELDSIVALPLNLSSPLISLDAFYPLKQFWGLKYQKIVGIYVIRNKENGKCYVGQSKDIVRRIKEHFNSTKPRNILVYDDYINSTLEDKSDLFEIAIFECSPEDLNKKEKEYIAYFDAYNEGYNQTHGNSDK